MEYSQSRNVEDHTNIQRSKTPSHLAACNPLSEFLESALDEIPAGKLILRGIIGKRLESRRRAQVPNVVTMLLVTAKCRVVAVGEDPVNFRYKLFLRNDEIPCIHIECM